ncbi:MAG: CHC2 zinc finger domain-containing protein [Oscillospiraceae bacterium]
MTIATRKTRGKFVRNRLPKPTHYYETQNIKLKGTGAWRDAICPFHKDTNPSLRINVEKGAYRCMVCGAHGGDVLAFHQHKHGLNFVEACKQLGAWMEVAE